MNGLRLLGLVCVTLVLVAGCGDDNPSSPTPTPTPAPTPAPTPTPPPAPAEPAALESIAVDPASVEGQSSPTATVTLTQNAPTGGAVVSLQSGSTNVAKVPSSVTVQAGQKTATFTVDTSTVPLSTQVTLQATYQNVTKLFMLTVRQPALNARFNITSPSQGTNGCNVITAGGAIDCVLDASQSTGFPANYIYTIKVGSTETTFTDSSGTFTPGTVCANLQGGTLDGQGAFSMNVTLVLEDRAGARSSPQSMPVAIYPMGRCGY